MPKNNGGDPGPGPQAGFRSQLGGRELEARFGCAGERMRSGTQINVASRQVPVRVRDGWFVAVNWDTEAAAAPQLPTETVPTPAPVRTPEPVAAPPAHVDDLPAKAPTIDGAGLLAVQTLCCGAQLIQRRFTGQNLRSERVDLEPGSAQHGRDRRSGS